MITIDAASLAQMILVILTGSFGGLAAWQQYRRMKEKQGHEADMLEKTQRHEAEIKRLEREKIEADAKAETEKAKADEERAKAARIRNDSEGELVKAHAEASLLTQMAQSLGLYQQQSSDAFRLMSEDSAANRAVQEKQTEAITLLTTATRANHAEVITNLGSLASKITPVAEGWTDAVQILSRIDDMLSNMSQVVKGARLSLLVEPVPNLPIPMPEPSTEVQP